jgi:acetylornithine deacetylase/succinyl-diaminopimelate desuccinylase-like protein
MTIRTLLPVLTALTVFLGAAAPPALEEEGFRSVEADILASEDVAVDRLVLIGGIPSPSGDEFARAAVVAEIMSSIGLHDVRVTGAPNVVGTIPGRSGRPLVFVSTLDDLVTVAEHQAARGRPPSLDGRRVEGPGTNTSSTTIAMLTAAEALLANGFAPEHDLVFAAVAQEETGLDGMRALYDTYKDDAVAFVDVLGDGSTVSYGALGIHWWRITASGPPGHTLRGGLPNVNLGIAKAVEQIMALPHPADSADRMTRANVAILRSGSVFNHKPAEGWFSLDLRSLDAETIATMEAETRTILSDVSAETGIAFTMTEENIVPGGQIEGALETDLVRWAVAIGRHLGLDPELSDAGSANLNVAIADGTLAIGLGGERGGERGHPDEWADIDAMLQSARHVALLALTVGGDRPAPARQVKE